MVDVDQLSQALHAQITSIKFLRCIFVAETGYISSEKTPKKIQLFWGEGLLKETTNPEI